MEKKAILLSFVIPVFNRPEEIRACVDSILALGTDNYEIVLVENGSTDGETPAVCEELARKHPVIHLVHIRENNGPGPARNAAFNAAQGEYIHCVDSDDRIFPDAMRELLAKAEEWRGADIVRFATDYDRTTMYGRPKELTFSQKGYVLLTDEVLEEAYSPGVMTTYFFRRDFALQHNIRCPSVFTAGEDGLFSLQLFLTAKSVYFYPEFLYCRTLHSRTSLVETQGYAQIEPMIGAWQEYVMPLRGGKNDTSVRELLRMRYLEWACALRFVYDPSIKIDDLLAGECPRGSLEDALISGGVTAVLKRFWCPILRELSEKTESFTRPLYVYPSGKIGPLLAQKILDVNGRVDGFLNSFHGGAVRLNGPDGESVERPIYTLDTFQTLVGKEDVRILIIHAGKKNREDSCRKLEGLGFHLGKEIILGWI